MLDVVVVGSLNLDLVARASRLPGPGETVIGSTFHEYPGGKGLNQAVACARSGARVAMIGAIGDDDAGRSLRRVAVAEAIDDSAISTITDTATGRAIISVDDHAENSIIVVPGANHRVPLLQLPACHIVLAQLEIPTETVIEGFRIAKSAGATTILNPAPATALPAELLALTDIIIPNEHEVELIGGVEALRDAGISTVVVTKGARGVDVTDHAGTTSYPAHRVATVDTTGAGDAFCGSLAARLAAGASFDDSVRWASAAGALATMTAGAVPSLPMSVDIERLVADALPA